MEKKTHILLLAAMLLLTGCLKDGRIGEYIDKQVELTREEFKEALLPDPYSRSKDTDVEEEEPPIPEMSDILMTPSDRDESEEKLISLSVTEEVPLKDVLIEISRMADIDMEVDAGIEGGVIFRVKDKPYMEVIERVADLGGLRYEEINGVLRVERDAPYVKSYTVDFLNLVRSNSGGVSISTQVLSSSGGDSGEGLSSGSTNEITSQYDGDIWTALEEGLTNIMTYKPESLAVVVEDGVATPVAQSEAQSSFSINKQAGVVTALATHKQHKSVEKYLKKVRRNATAQVLIEAKIVEVTLDEEFRTGINWGSTGTNPTDFLKANRSGAGALLGFTDALNRSDGSIAETAQFALFRGDKSTLKAAVQMMESFGTSRTLSSPRLNALNNQQAVLTFAENKVYFTVEVSKETETTAGGATEETVLADSTVNTVPIGIILTLQPSIDLDKEEITMNIRPTLSRITSFVDDPGVNLQVKQIDTSLNISSQIPVIEVRELDSMLKMRNGQIMVMGGLMEERTVNQDTGLPYVSRMPVLGSLFKGTSKTTEIVETVIFIKATIVNEPMVHDADKKLYRHFTRDPRPLAF